MTMAAPVLPPPSAFKAGTSEWWIERLTIALHTRLDRYKRLEKYYNNEQDLSKLMSSSWRESEVSKMFPDGLRANHAKLIVNAAEQRLVIHGFRFAGQMRSDTEAARIWRANEMDAESAKAHVESMVKGECPVIVSPNPADPSTPLITPQDPEQVIVWHAPGDRRIRLAALKTWYDLDQRRRYYILYLPDRIEFWRDRDLSQMDHWLGRLFGARPPAWEQWSPAVVNPLGDVPVVVIPNGPRLSRKPEAEHEFVLGQIDNYNKTLMDMAVVSHEMAYPQRWGTGIEPDEEEDEPADPELAEPVPAPNPQVRTGATRLVTSPIPDASFGQFAAAQLENHVKALDKIRADIATDTFTPYHYLLNMPSSVPPSGESITASEAPLVDKVKAHQRDKGSAWRQVMRLALLLVGDKGRADAMRGGFVIWEDPERRTESQHVDALSKLASPPIGVPREAIWQMIPASPDEIELWIAMLEDEARRAVATAGAAPEVTPPGTADGEPEPPAT